MRRRKTGLGKKEEAEQTRARVIDAAITLFAKRGFASTSTHDLARAIGMTPGVLYWHFADKEAILAAVLDELQRRLFVALTREEERVTSGKGAERALTTSDTLRALIGRVARVMLVVTDSHLEVADVVIQFGNGQRWSPGLRNSFADGSRSRAIDLPGHVRFIRGLELVRGSVPPGTRAHVELWGQ